MSGKSSRSSSFLKQLFRKRKNFEKAVISEEIELTEQTMLDYYISFVRNYPGIILVYSLDGEIITYNKKNVHHFFGFKKNEKINFDGLVPENKRSALSKSFRQATKGTVTYVDVEITTKQGEQRNVRATFIPIQRNVKQIEGVFLLLDDFTEQKVLEQSKEIKKSHLKQALQIAQIGYWEYYLKEDIAFCSPSCYKLLGFNENVQLNKAAFISHIYEEDRDEMLHLLQQAISEGKRFKTDFRIIHLKSKEIRYMKIIVEIMLQNNKPYKLIGVIKDQTEQIKSHHKIVETNEQYRQIFNHLQAGIWMRESVHGRVIYASKGLEQLLQIPLEKIYTDPDYWKEILLPEYHTEYNEQYKLIQRGRSIDHTFRIEDGKGTTKWLREQTVPHTDKSGKITHLFGMVTDISPLVEMQQKLEFLAKYDPLTTLPNLSSLNEKIEKWILQGNIQSFALFYIDIDNFRTVNDSLGTEVGDGILKFSANRLRSLLPQKSYLAKVDSDAFVCLVPNYNDKDDIFILAENIMKNIGKKQVIHSYELYVTASIGISFYPDNATDRITLLNAAHTALYHAKRLGKNNYQIYSFDRDIGTHKKYLLEKDLRKAIECEEFEIHYQPQIDPKSGTIRSAEALIRWNHDEWGVVSPAEFIPLAEEKHLIHHIGDFVIRTVFQDLKVWKERELELFPISINVSPLRFLKHGLVQTLKDLLASTDIPAKYIQLELTESSLLEYDQLISHTLKDLKQLGIKIAIDDFGTGFSSFYYLQKYDFDTLKIDKSFIQTLEPETYSETKEAQIVSSLLYLGKQLNMTVVAEGVEEYEQLDFLIQKECDLIQGYIYSKPVSANTFEKMLRAKYLKPVKQKKYVKPKIERRSFYRFTFLHCLPAKMRITKMNDRNLSIGTATVLIENLSIGGARFLSTLRIPVISSMKLNFEFTIMKQTFNLDGYLTYIQEEMGEVFAYGVSFNILEGERDRLATVINKLTLLKKLNNEIPDTEFIDENPYLFLRKNLM